jgi:hypothetical protein
MKTGKCGLRVQQYCKRNQREEELSFLDSCPSSTRCTHLSLQCSNSSWVYAKKDCFLLNVSTKIATQFVEGNHQQQQTVCAKIFSLARYCHSYNLYTVNTLYYKLVFIYQLDVQFLYSVIYVLH